jgi:hypothetical protein
MDRRDFLKISGFATAGLFLASSSIKSIAKESISDTQFSIDAFVSDSDKAAAMIERFIKSNIKTKYTIKYSEYPYSSATNGDIVFILNNILVDIVNPKDQLAYEISEIRKSLSLPGYIENPVRIRVYTENSSPLKKVFVSQKGKIISELPTDRNEEYTYYGKSGKIVLKANDNKFSVKTSECKHQICSRMGKIEKGGDYIACIPNEIQIFSE